MFFDYEPYYDIFHVAMISYIPIVFGLKYYMNNYISNTSRKYLCDILTLPWASWCFSLSIFSMFGTYYTGKFLILDHYETDIKESDAFFWYNAFILSKIPELFDTIFIVLRSKPLVALQWYHHIATLAFCYGTSYLQCDVFAYFFFMNYFVHMFMYFYFGLYCFHKSSFMRNIFGTFVNIIQTIQMLFGTFIAFSIYINIEINKDIIRCVYIPDDKKINKIIYCAILMYISYFVLFIQVYYDRSKRISKVNNENNEIKKKID